MVNMKEVAKRSGVSVATVSRYINKSGYVSAKSAENIQEAIDETNYVPNEVARSLFQKKSKLIGVLLPDITNPFVTMLSKGIENHLNDSEYGLILANVNNDVIKEEQYLTNFKSNNIAGIISAIEHQTQLDKDLLYVSIDRPSQTEKISVSSNDFRGGQLAAEEIVKRTDKEIFIIRSLEHVDKSELRLNGIASVLKGTGHTYYVQDVPSFRPEEAEGIIATIVKNHPNVDSIIAANDVQAMVLLKEANEHGLRVPEDIQIIGAELLLRMINGERISDNNIILPVKFVNRGTLKQIKE